jgi:hypothetical protein
MIFSRSIIAIFLTVSVAVCAQTVTNSELATRLEASRSSFSQWDHGADLRALAQSKNQDISRRLVVNETPILCDNCPKPDASNHPEVRMAVVASNVVLVARNVQNISALTTNNAFAFTNSDLKVEQVWKGGGSDAQKGEILPGGEITVSTPGGTVHVDRHTISISVSNRIPMQVGHSYLLFLKYLPESSTYVVSSLDGFDVTGPTVIPLSTTMKPPLEEYLSNPATFLNLMQQSTNRAINAEGVSDLSMSAYAGVINASNPATMVFHPYAVLTGTSTNGFQTTAPG